MTGKEAQELQERLTGLELWITRQNRIIKQQREQIRLLKAEINYIYDHPKKPAEWEIVSKRPDDGRRYDNG